MIAFPDALGVPATHSLTETERDDTGRDDTGRDDTERDDTERDDTERLGDEIALLAAHLHAATYRLLVLIREFDEREGWGGGFLSCAHWLSWRTGISPGPAREKVRVARALATLPLISGAMAQGELSYSKVRALSRVASPANEADLLEVARHATAAQVERLVRSWRRVDRIEEPEEEERRHQSRSLSLYQGHDGTYVIRGRLDTEVGALLEKALEWASDALYREGEREGGVAGGAAGGAVQEETAATFGQRRADALGFVAERALADAASDNKVDDARTTSGSHTGDVIQASDGRAGNRPSLPRWSDRFQVVVHVEVDGLAVPEEPGIHLSAEPSGPSGRKKAFPRERETAELGRGETSRRLSCDAGVVVMTHDREGQVLDVGRRRRTVPPALRRALEYRDKGCRFPGCGCRYTEAHHITHWADGGETKLENLVLLCRRHHRLVHEGGVRVEIGRVADGGEGAGGGTGPEGEVRFLRPDGREIPRVPGPPILSADPIEDLVRVNAARGSTPDEWTARSLWNGDSIDYSLAIDMLRRE